MADENVDPAEARVPNVGDVAAVCAHLNAQGARYLVVGGFAMIQHGYLRTTGDIDLLIEDSLLNQQRVRRALEFLPEKAILELGVDEDLRDWVVLRVADEIVVDVMTAACGVSYAEAEAAIQSFEIQGVAIPFASAPLMLRLKQTLRAKDEEDRLFLQRLIAREDPAH